MEMENRRSTWSYICLVCGCPSALITDSDGRRVTVKLEKDNTSEVPENEKDCVLQEGEQNFKWEISLFHFFLNYCEVEYTSKRQEWKSKWNFNSEAVPFCEGCKNVLFPLKSQYEEILRMKKELRQSIEEVKEKMVVSEAKFKEADVYNNDERYYWTRSKVIGASVVGKASKVLVRLQKSERKSSSRRDSDETMAPRRHRKRRGVIDSELHSDNTSKKADEEETGDLLTETENSLDWGPFENDSSQICKKQEKEARMNLGPVPQKSSDNIDPPPSLKHDYFDCGGPVDEAEVNLCESSHDSEIELEANSKDSERKIVNKSLISSSLIIESKKRRRKMPNYNDNFAEDDWSKTLTESEEDESEKKETKKPKKKKKKSDEDEDFNPTETEKAKEMSLTVRRKDWGKYNPIFDEESGQYRYLTTYFNIISDGRGFQCTTCQAEVSSKNLMKHHVKKFHLTLQCPWTDCSFVGRTKPVTEDHFNKHHDKTFNKSYACDICGKPLTRKNNLRNHRMTHMNKDEKEKAKLRREFCYQCSKCNLIVESNYKLQLHEKECLSTEQGDLIDLMEKTGEKRMFLCPQCGKSFKSSRCLKSHQRCVHPNPEEWGAQPFACVYCDRRFVLEKDLKKHKTIHTGDYPYPCSLCERKFSDKYNFERHMKLHTNDRPYQCEYCPFAFVSKYRLKRHFELYHAEGANPKRPCFYTDPSRGRFRAVKRTQKVGATASTTMNEEGSKELSSKLS